MRDRWCLNCRQYVQPRVGWSCGDNITAVIAFAVGGSLGYGSSAASGNSDLAIQLAGLGALVLGIPACLLIGLGHATRRRSSRTPCPICNGKSLTDRPAP